MKWSTNAIDCWVEGSQARSLGPQLEQGVLEAIGAGDWAMKSLRVRASSLECVWSDGGRVLEGLGCLGASPVFTVRSRGRRRPRAMQSVKETLKKSGRPSDLKASLWGAISDRGTREIR